LTTEQSLAKKQSWGRWEMITFYLSAMVTLFGFSMLWYYMFFPRVPIKLNHPIYVKETTLLANRAFTKIYFTMDYCKSQVDLFNLAETHYALKDGISYDLPGTYTEFLPAGCHVITEILIVPMLTEGKYQLEMYRFYRTPLRDTIVTSISNIFQVKYSTPEREILIAPKP
jgi:hypothetical protein